MALPISMPSKYGGRCRYERWRREINYTRLIRREVCSDCIKSASANITQTPSTLAKLFQSGLSCLKLSVTSSVEEGLAIFLRDSVWKVRGGGKSCPLAFAGSEYSAITVKSTNLCHPLPTPQRWQAEAHLEAQKSTKCQGKSSKVCWRAAGADKNTDECGLHRLFNLGCYARKNDIPSLLMHTLYKQHNVTHSLGWASGPDGERRPREERERPGKRGERASAI